MKQEWSGLRRWRLPVVLIGIVPLMLLAPPAQAGLGDLIDRLLSPVEEVPVVGQVVDPIVEEVVNPAIQEVIDPLAGGVLDPLTNQVLAPIVEPIVEAVVAPLIENVVAPTVQTVTVPALGSNPSQGSEQGGSSVGQSGAGGEISVTGTGSENQSTPSSGQALSLADPFDPPAAEFDSLGAQRVQPSGDSRTSTPASSPAGTPPSRTSGLDAAMALQTALAADANTSMAGSTINGTESLKGLTDWLRDAAAGFIGLLAFPVRLFELVARALMTAGSGLIAPLSLLLAYTAFAIKDRGWWARFTVRWGQARGASGKGASPSLLT